VKYEKLKKNEELITSLGYQEMPKEMYEQMMKDHEYKGNVQNQYQFTGKEKRNYLLKLNKNNFKIP